MIKEESSLLNPWIGFLIGVVFSIIVSVMVVIPITLQIGSMIGIETIQMKIENVGQQPYSWNTKDRKYSCIYSNRE